MPRKASAKNSAAATPKGKKTPRKPRIAPNGYKLPDPLPEGVIVTDVTKKEWILGKSIGLGGFGEIYLASDDVTKLPGVNAKYVIKIEPHSNGPLFCEMHFYHRVGRADLIAEWMQKKKLKFLGMPRMYGSGSHEYKNVKYRFMILERFGEDLQKLLERNHRLFPVKTVYTLGIKILNILEYVHSHGYIHADVKASNLMCGFGKGKEDEVHLIDFGLACKYVSDGVHKEYKEDLRKAHDGTIEYTSRDAHIGAHSRRGDLEILGYNMLQWLCGRLPWENNLKDPDYVSSKKTLYMNDIPKLMKDCFPSRSPAPQGIAEYMTYVARLKFEETPNYEHCIGILASGIKACGFKNDGKLVYKSDKKQSPAARKRSPAKLSKDYVPAAKVRKTNVAVDKTPSERAGALTPHRKDRRVASATPRLQSPKCKRTVRSDGTTSGISNPTPAMLLVMQRKIEQMKEQSDISDSKKNGVISVYRKPNLLQNGTVGKVHKSAARGRPLSESYGNIAMDSENCEPKLLKKKDPLRLKGPSFKVKRKSIIVSKGRLRTHLRPPSDFPM